MPSTPTKATPVTDRAQYEHAVRLLRSEVPATELAPIDDYIEAERGDNGRWIYGFGDLDVGDQMRCPIAEGEEHRRAGIRVLSAAICWKKKNLAEQRKHIRFRSQVRTRYVLIERIA